MAVFKIGDIVSIKNYDDPITCDEDHLFLTRAIWDRYNGMGKIVDRWDDRARIETIDRGDGIYERWVFKLSYLDPIDPQDIVQFDIE